MPETTESADAPQGRIKAIKKSKGECGCAKPRRRTIHQLEIELLEQKHRANLLEVQKQAQYEIFQREVKICRLEAELGTATSRRADSPFRPNQDDDILEAFFSRDRS